MYVVPGSMLTPTLRIVRPLKEGGVGNIWVAENTTDGSALAVKFLSEDVVRLSPEALKRFRREAKAAISLRGPHIIRTFDFGTMEDGTPYIVMELLEGESLGERLERAGALHPHHVASVVAQAADALQTAHDQGLVHRDVKPDNIFLVQGADRGANQPPFVKVLDFGTVKQIRQRSDSLLTATGMIVGTPEYMSPEQVFAAKDIDHRADIWGLGAVAYHALTGKLPFEADSPHALVLVIANAELRPPSEVDGQLSATVDQWFARAMARSPQDRFTSAKEMARAFAAAVGAEPLDPAGMAEPAFEEEEDEETLRFQPGIHPDPSVPELGPAPTVETALMAATQPTPLDATTRSAIRSPATLRRGLLVGAVVAGTILLLGLVAGLALALRADDDRAADEPAADRYLPTGAERTPVPALPSSATKAEPPSLPAPTAAVATASASAEGSVDAAPSRAAPDAGTLPGYASIICIPQCDQVIVRGRALGPSPIRRTRLPPGRHEVILRRAGSPDQTEEIEVRPDQASTHQFAKN